MPCLFESPSCPELLPALGPWPFSALQLCVQPLSHVVSAWRQPLRETLPNVTLSHSLTPSPWSSLSQSLSPPDSQFPLVLVSVLSSQGIAWSPVSSGAGSLQLLEELENCRKTNSPGKPEDSSKQGDYGQESGKLTSSVRLNQFSH